MTEAERRHLAEIAADCRGVLGTGLELVGLDREVDVGGVRLTAHLRLGDVTRITAVRGATLHEAHVELRRRLVEDRLGLGFEALVGRT